MTPKTLAGALAGVFALLFAGCANPNEVRGGELPRSAARYAGLLVEETNRARTADGLARLDRDPCADKAATGRAEALLGEDLEHRPLNDLVADCAPGHRAAENLVETSRTAEEVVAAWMGSPGHRNNIVDPALTTTGVGCVPTADGFLCSQLFLGEQQ